MKTQHYITILLTFVIGVTFAKAQNFSASRGLPFIRNYSSEEYNAHEQNFDIIQNKSGIMYFANFAGILEFDGTTWNKITTSSGMRVLSLSINKKGTIFVGGLYDFGYLKQNMQGITSFVSLADSIEDKVEIGEIFKAVCAQEELNYFVSEKKLFISKKGKLSVINFHNNALSVFYVNNELYIFFDATTTKQSSQFGLCKFKNGEFITIASEQSEKILDIKSMFQLRESEDIALASSKQGIFLLQEGEIVRLNIAANNYTKQHSLSCIVNTNSETYGIGTINGGFVLTDTLGSILQILDKNSGLQDESINAAFIDKKNAVWLATNNGISKVEINWPVSFYDNKRTGLEGKVLDIEKIGSTMFFATDKGLYYLQENNFQAVKGINSACWSMLLHENNLWVATTNGIYKVANKQSQLSKIKEFTFCLSKSKLHKNKFFAGHSGNVSIININSGKLEIINSIENLDGDVQNIMEEENGDILIEIPPGKIYLYSVKTNKLSEIKSENNFISLHINNKNDDIFFSSEKGLFTYNKNTLKLTSYNLFDTDTSSHSLWIHDFFTLSDSSYLITDGEQKNLALFYKSEKKFNYLQTPYLPIADFSNQTLYNDITNNTFWSGGKDGLIKSEYNLLFNYKTQYSTLIRKITNLNNDSLIELLNNKGIKQLSYSKNSLRFDFSLPAFPAKGKIRYRIFLKGFDNDTSAWNTLTYKDYTNLPDGNYKFSVQAKNEFGETAAESVFKFQILTPNYRTWWAIAIYIILFLAFGYFILQWQMKAAEKEKEVLEDLVKERTLEIEQGRKEVEKQRDIAYKQKQEILDSINYAQKIQEAVLPSKEFADEILNEHFIMYRPRDIVSGDFYWIKKVNNYITVVAADCTGHGVPGAFMSMLGSSFLNEIVTRRSLDNAGQILNRLRSKVKKSLHQEGKSGEQKDGMDVALLIIDTETLELQYAGAYNPLYIIRKNTNKNKNEDENLADYELIQLKADRQPIGIYLLEKEFTNHSFQLEKEDCIYSFSDGYVDQFGGETGGKFKTTRFKELLLSVQGKPMTEQKRILEQNFIKWKRDVAQLDDVLVMGIRI